MNPLEPGELRVPRTNLQFSAKLYSEARSNRLTDRLVLWAMQKKVIEIGETMKFTSWFASSHLVFAS